MAYFAKLGTNNIVEKVISIHNSVLKDSNGIEQEQLGIDFIKDLYKTEDIWKQTSYNTYGGVHSSGGTPLRKNYAGIGYTYDEQKDAFIPPKPYASWILNENTCLFESPIPMPNDDKLYNWNENTLSWDLI